MCLYTRWNDKQIIRFYPFSAYLSKHNQGIKYKILFFISVFYALCNKLLEGLLKLLQKMMCKKTRLVN